MKPKILLVEDEPLLREMTREDLRDLGYSAICARNAPEGWDVLQHEESIGVLITDIRMPGEFDGWELARRARNQLPSLGIIYISGYSGEEQQLAAGGVFLKKPYRLPDMERALSEVVPS